MTRDEFIDRYCARSKMTREQFFEHGDAVPCNCGEGTCAGWQYKTQPDPDDRCGHPDCKGSLVCAEPGCEAMHPNACAEDTSAAGWRCHKHLVPAPSLWQPGCETLVIAQQVPLGIPPPGDLVVLREGGREVVRFKADGTIVLGDGYTPTEAAEAFIEMLRDKLPSVGRLSELEAELADRDEWLKAAAAHASELEALASDLWSTADDWHGERASSHYRSRLAERLRKLKGESSDT